MGIFSKNDSIEYKKLENYAQFTDTLLSLDEYISRKNYISKKDELSKQIDEFKLMDEKSVLVNWCKNNKTDYKKPKAFIPKVISILMDLNVLNKFKNEKGYENINLNQNVLADSQVLILE